jgi:hypothetical protein
MLMKLNSKLNQFAQTRKREVNKKNNGKTPLTKHIIIQTWEEPPFSSPYNL